MSSFMMIFFFFFFIFFFDYKTEALNSDGLSLLALKAAIDSDPSGMLRHWSESDATPCRWPGVVCTRGRVTDLYLPNKGFSGYIPSELGRLDSLKRLGLSRNNFSKPIPDHLFQAQSLVVLDLSRNSLTGPIPAQIGLLNSTLRHLDLSSNGLTGPLPESLADLQSLVGTLNLSFNALSGDIPAAYGRIPVLVSLDLRRNNLSGEIPRVGSLLNQGPTAFAGNPGLCGFPLGVRCPAEEPRIHGGERERDGADPQKPLISDPEAIERGRERERGRGSLTAATVPIISGITAAVGVASVSVWLCRRRRSGAEGKRLGGDGEEAEDGEGQNGKFAALDEGFGLELEDLLRASAHVVGKSRSGIVYRVVVAAAPAAGGGKSTEVAVRRLSEGDATWRLREFEAEMEAIGGARHPNIVRLRAYYFAADEKLLITDFVRNGTLYSALHGEPSDSSRWLLWSSRLKIAQGTARGLMYIHEHSPRKHVHGRLRSTKILLDDDLEPRISGFGLTRLVPGSSKFTASASEKWSSAITMASGLRVSSAPSNAYLAPEVRVSGSNKLTQKCDVYSFGVVLLELLTGKLPDVGLENDEKGLECLVRKAFREERPLSEIIDPALLGEVHAKKQVVSAFHIALNCTEIDPEIRPRMRTVSDSLDRIRLQ